MHQPHIVMLNKAYPPWIGGIESHVRDLSEGLVQRGYRVTALVCHEGRNTEQIVLNGVNVVRVGTWGNFLSQPIAFDYFKHLQELQPDVVHVHVPFPLGWFSATHVDASIPILCTWHSDIIRQRFLKLIYHRFEKRFLKRCQTIISTSPQLLEHSVELKNFRDKVTVIPLALPEPPELHDTEFADELSKLKNESGKPLVSFVGRLVGYKGLRYHSGDGTGDAQLIIAGDGPMGYPPRITGYINCPRENGFICWGKSARR